MTYSFLLFYYFFNLYNYAGDNTLYNVGKNLDKIKIDLQSNISILQKRFYENHMVLNPGKSHYIFIGGHTKIDCIICNGLYIERSRNETFLGVNLDNDLKFDLI